MSDHGSVDGKGSCRSLRQPGISIKMQRSFRKMRESIQRITESIQDDDKHSLYIFPEQLSTLTWRTGFSKDEIRRLYRTFKQLCPRGCVITGNLKLAYAKLFPLGDPGRYAQIVFNSFDKDGDGIVSFSDLLRAMASIINGDVDQKLSWIFELSFCKVILLIIILLNKIYESEIFIIFLSYFVLLFKFMLSNVANSRRAQYGIMCFLGLLLIRFYDLNGDGCITRQEMLAIISAIYEMAQDAQSVQTAVNRQVDRFFEKMDADRDGVVTREEFMSGCKKVWTANVSLCRKNMNCRRT
ncbi:Calsenilin [Ooceraea biroi]|uniref:Calsenilin n=1 Tax=Ooceraea biroi TaxID=2015173 RepID=A0A026WNY6_OOCBI|nr:Calsenilin [Ooceraea biroi]